MSNSLVLAFCIFGSGSLSLYDTSLSLSLSLVAVLYLRHLFISGVSWKGGIFRGLFSFSSFFPKAAIGSWRGVALSRSCRVIRSHHVYAGSGGGG
ncbi:MAG: hypothetical protein OK454_05580, partial [Thaumarchaeota archaeon]|nr:hypothetical protein [Nitrososphaerota archaeon]